MNELRELRRAVGLGQREFAALLSIPLETFRRWDSGRRVVPVTVLRRARDAVTHHARQTELLPLGQLANELNVHLRTLQAAARTGRLEAHFTVNSVFGTQALSG
jgi:transcriptional regulator with XRE-family HTH domain